MKLFNTYVRSKIDYCCIVWSPWCQNDIDRVERIQKSFTSKIEGVEELNYHQRLKKLKLYCLERRRERFMLINTWQQIEGLRENVLQFRERWIGRNRNIKSNRVPTSPLNIIHYSPARKMERLFNCLLPKIKAITGVKPEQFKKEA